VPAQKPILLNANHLFVWHKMFVTATIFKYIFGLAQKIWTSPKHFETCKRTRQKTVASDRGCFKGLRSPNVPKTSAS
jgi:hypothetical protein